jgi:hypothetical protein
VLSCTIDLLFVACDPMLTCSENRFSPTVVGTYSCELKLNPGWVQKASGSAGMYSELGGRIGALNAIFLKGKISLTWRHRSCQLLKDGGWVPSAH